MQVFFRSYWAEKGNKQSKSNKPLQTVNSWKGPFRTDHMRADHLDEHAERCEEYQSLSEAKKIDYFNIDVPFTETLLEHYS